MLAKPDPNTFELAAVAAATTRRSPGCSATSQIFSGEPFDGDPRYVLKRNLERAREKGFTFFVGPEMEFFYFRSRRRRSGAARPRRLLRPHRARPRLSELRKQTRSCTLEAMGIPVEYSFHENGPSQHEIDLRYTDALTMADNVMTFRLDRARRSRPTSGVYATFMPKPIAGAFGSGMHTHLSLFEGDVNAFHDPGDEYGLSKVGEALHRRPAASTRSEITAVTNQWVNSYKRLIAGYEAPVYMCWARNNRSALVRVPLPKRGKNESTRIEFRSPDPACNPYLAFSVMLAAGLKGIEEGYDLPPEATEQHLRADRRGARWPRASASLPQSLARRARRDGALRARRRGARRARLRELPPQQAAGVGRVQGRTSPRSSSTATSGRSDTGDRDEPTRASRSWSSPTRRRRCSRRRSTSSGHRVEGGRERGGRDAARAAPTAGPARSCAPTTTPRARSRSAARCASATRRVESILLLIVGRAAARARAPRGPLRRLLPLAVPPQGARGAPAAPLLAHRARARGPRSSSTATSCSTSRRTRPRSAGKPLDLTYMEYELLKFFAHAPGQGVHPRAAALTGVGLRVLRRRAHGRRPRAAAAGQARRGAREPDPDGALGRLPLRPDPLARRPLTLRLEQPRGWLPRPGWLGVVDQQPADAARTRSRRRA